MTDYTPQPGDILRHNEREMIVVDNICDSTHGSVIAYRHLRFVRDEQSGWRWTEKAHTMPYSYFAKLAEVFNFDLEREEAAPVEVECG